VTLCACPATGDRNRQRIMVLNNCFMMVIPKNYFCKDYDFFNVLILFF